MKTEELEKLIKKAKDRKDGIYAQSPHYFTVKSGRLGFIGCKYSGKIYQFAHGFMCSIGQVEPYKVRKHLQELSRSK